MRCIADENNCCVKDLVICDSFFNIHTKQCKDIQLKTARVLFTYLCNEYQRENVQLIVDEIYMKKETKSKLFLMW